MNKIKDFLGLHSVQKKVLLLSKVVGIGFVLFYVLADRLAKNSVVIFWIGLIILSVVVLGFDLLLKHFITSPLNTIKETSEKMANLDFSIKSEIHTGDEFEEISDSLNQMSRSLQNALSNLAEANKKLSIDIEKEHLLQTQRKELVDSLSHEMKTPLGIIKAYTEGIADETDKEKQKKYMEVIISNVNRMDNLIVSLLDLSGLEAGAIKLNKKKFDFIELVETVAGRLLYDIPDPKFRFEYSLPDDKVIVTADKNRMSQVLENLVENAKKHVCLNGIINIRIIINDDSLCFSIYNQGSHIPEQELKRVWDKFYKSNSHNQRGNGLGLAIAAQILIMHNCSYKVENTNDGVKFSVCIPIE